MSKFGYVGATAPTQSETAGNTGIFSVDDVKNLKDNSQLQKTGPVVTYLIVGGGGGGRSGNVSGGGGGGAGEVRTGTIATAKGAAITVDIGAGGGNNAKGSDTTIVIGGVTVTRANGGGTYNSRARR